MVMAAPRVAVVVIGPSTNTQPSLRSLYALLVERR
jgi:hypothetical protein